MVPKRIQKPVKAKNNKMSTDLDIFLVEQVLARSLSEVLAEASLYFPKHMATLDCLNDTPGKPGFRSHRISASFSVLSVQSDSAF